MSMNNEIMVTVMVTFYNQKKYIKDSLSVIFNQKTNFKYEVICGDDGSSDGTYEELLEWQKKYPEMCTVVQMPREYGEKYEPIVRVSNNRHAMLKKAKGKYVTFIDGDDYYTDLEKLQKQVDILEKHPDCVACGHPVMMVWENDINKRQERCHIADHPVRIKKEIYWAYLWFHADTFLFRNIYKGKETKINSDFFDDNLIACYFIKYGDVIYIPDAMVAYRQIENSSWNMRTKLQQALVNMQIYSESKKVIPEMKLQCFLKCQSAWKNLYRNRKCDMDFVDIRKTFEKESVVVDTLRYKDSSIVYKLYYEIKYFIPMHLGWLVKICNGLQKNTYKKIN